MVSRLATHPGRLTELGIDYVARQVPVDKDQRTALRSVAGTDRVPTLVLIARSKKSSFN